MKPKPYYSLLAIFLLGVLFISGLSGCAAGTPTATPGHNLLYALNFENEAAFAGWHVGAPGQYEWLKNVKDGKYLFEYPSGFLESQDFDFGDVQIAVDVEFLVKTRVEVGLSCRMQPGASGRYVFNIANDGRWNIRKWNGDDFLLAEGWSDAIQPDKNRLAARCVGDQLTLLVNDLELGSARDGDFTSGFLSFGYAAETAGAGTFDNLSVEDWGASPASQENPENSEILYAENFDKPEQLSGWDVKANNSNSQAEIKNGAYRLSVENGEVAAIQRDLNFTNSTLTVDLEFLGPDPAKASITCRNLTGGYIFSITNTGHWQIDRSDAKLPARGDTQALHAGANQLTVTCLGNQLAFSLNGGELGSAQDDAFSEGQIAFGLESTGKAQVAFDNLTVSGPAAQGAESAPTQVAALEPATPTPAPVSTATPVPTAISTLRPTVIPEGELTLYQTEFDDGDSSLADWKTFAYSFAENGFVTAGYEANPANGVYRIRTSDPQKGANLRIFAIYDQDLGADVDLSTRGRAPYDEGSMGLVCRYSEAGWYQFMLEPNGIWSVRLVKPDETGQLHFHTISSGGKWLGAKADLRAECKGDRLTFYIDGEKYASLRDNAFPTGKVGLLGWSFDRPGEIGLVDNFTVQRAQWNETGLPGPAPTPGADGAIYSTDFAKLDDLNPYWEKVDIGVQGIPGSPVLVGGPGQPSPHTYIYLNDFDPGPEVEITADVRAELNFPRGLICRYSEDGWYETFFMKDAPQYRRVALVRAERDEQGKMMRYIIDTYYPPTPAAQVNLTLTCAGNQISVKANGEQVLYTEDNTWRTGRYGFLLTDNPPGNFRSNTLLNYTVRPAQAVKIGDLNYDQTFETPETIASATNLDLTNDPRLKVQEDALLFAPDKDPIHPLLSRLFENGELSVDAEFLTAGTLNLHCRIESASPIGAEIHPNGDWNLVLNFDKTLASGNSPAIQSGKNQLTLSCSGSKITLKANGETLSSVEIPEYSPAQGQAGWDVYEGSQVKITKVALKAFVSEVKLTQPPLLNQVVLSPAYQPGEIIFAWDMNKFINGCGSGWWGRDTNPCLWQKSYRRTDWERSWQGETVWVEGYNNILTLFTYQPDLYDLPVEISAQATLTSKGGAVALFCRATPVGRYEFYIQPDGKWFIRRNVIASYYLPKNKDLTILANGTVENFSLENAQLTATCNGPDLIFSLNGAELGRAQDPLYPEGQAGIFFDVFSEGSFTNLVIKRAK